MARLTLSDASRLSAANRPWCFRMEYTGWNGSNQGGSSAKFWLATGRGRTEPVEIHYGKIGTAGTVIVKDWAYVETKAPEKEAKGYDYEDTPFVRVRQATIDAFAAKGGQPAPATKPVTRNPAVKQTPAPTPPAPAPTKPIGATGSTPTTWRCDTGQVTVTTSFSHRKVIIVFDQFPQPWCNEHQSGAFKVALKAQFGRDVWWGGIINETFDLLNADLADFLKVVAWFQSLIPGLTTPLNGAPPLTGPFAQIATVKSMAGGKWIALRADGRKLLDLTAKGARDLTRDYPQITVAGL